MADEITHQFTAMYITMTVYFVCIMAAIGFVGSAILNAIEKEREK